MSSFEQRANIKFCIKLKKPFTETLVLMNEAYEDEILSRTQIYFWYKRFKDYSYAQVRSASVSMELPLVNVSTCELRSVIRFFTAKNKTAVNIHHNLVLVYCERCMSIQMVRRWHSWFLEGRQNVHDDERSCRPVMLRTMQPLLLFRMWWKQIAASPLTK
ncbi:hypothetical protein LAZ67_7001300 [Cordylochernes scorpioides]|uniref:Mos1 transposase HTH domain-containing protein n=1 Tax=Cordylochernes scorpioides TaxID=51811 RepID=A0ABY6KQS2_9ARAC|nr:hypothetical protein LAZ67_7001300 [Cordylochernes scorpioides]